MLAAAPCKPELAWTWSTRRMMVPLVLRFQDDHEFTTNDNGRRWPQLADFPVGKAGRRAPRAATLMSTVPMA